MMPWAEEHCGSSHLHGSTPFGSKGRFRHEVSDSDGKLPCSSGTMLISSSFLGVAWLFCYGRANS